MKHHDHFPGTSLEEALNCLELDFEMLDDESWVPEKHSVNASIDMVESVRAKLEKLGVEV